MNIRPTTLNLSVLLCVMVMMLCSCAQSKLKIAVIAANQQCPMTMGMMELSGVEYKGDVVTLNLKSDISEAQMALLQQNPALIKQGLQVYLFTTKDQVRRVIELLIEANAGVNLVLQSPQTIEKMTVRLSPEELRKAATASPADLMQQMNGLLNLQNLDLNQLLNMEQLQNGNLNLEDLENLNLENLDIDDIKDKLHNLFK